MAATAGFAPITTPDGADLSANQTPRILGACITFLVLSTTLVTLRFVARFLSKAGLWWDDWLILVAMFVSWGPNILVIYSTTHGFGQHIAAQGNIINRISEAEWWFKNLYVYEVLYALAATLAKYSILLFYARIFKEPRFQFWLKAVFAITTAFFLACEITIFTECIPTPALWDPTVNGTCINIFAFFTGTGVPNVIINFVILVMPLPMVWALEISLQDKLALSGVFLLGSFVVAASIVRLVIFSQLQLIDVTWEFVDASLWNAAEPSIAVCSASLPILRSLWIWNLRKRAGRNGTATPESYDEPKAPMGRSRAPANRKGVLPGVHKKGGSIESQQFPLNELPAGAQQMYGNRVVVAGGPQGRKPSDDEEMWSDLPIMHPQEAAYAHYGRQNYNQTPSDRSELYG